MEQPAVLERYNEKLTDKKAPRRPWLALAGIVAILVLSSELELLEQLDSMSLYMTYREIALDASVALFIVLDAAILWWFVCLLCSAVVRIVGTQGKPSSAFWRIGLACPIMYFVIGVCNALRLEILPNWHPAVSSWLWLSLLCTVIVSRVLYLIDLSALQEFCRIQLMPIALLHVLILGVGAMALRLDGIYLLRDYEHAGQPTATSRLPDIYLITVDAFSAEHASLYGYDLSTTPNLERLAGRSFTFDHFFANSNITTPATTSIETGKFPWSHRVFQLGGFLRDEARGQNLPELLRQRGYYTASIASNYVASPMRHGTLASYDAVEYLAPRNLSGLWVRYTNLAGLNTQNTLNGPILKRLAALRFYLDTLVRSRMYPNPAEPVFDKAQVLIERRDIKQPRFLWMHILPPHDPYLAPAPYMGHFLPGEKLTRTYQFVGLRNTQMPQGVSVEELRSRYDECVLYADHAVGEFLDWLDKTGRLDSSIVIVSADHGESFEHNWLLHGGPYLYDGVIHIPLLVHLPGQREGVRIDSPAQQADLLPTLLDLVGGQVPSWTDGVSLKPLLQGQSIRERHVFSMNFERNRELDTITKGTVAVIDNEFKYIYQLGSQQEELYRYRTDKLEDHNLLNSDPDVAKRMREMLLTKLKEVNERVSPKP